MSLLSILGAICAPLVVLALVGFLIEAANAFGDVPPQSRPLTEDERRSLVRREFDRPPMTDIDEGFRRLEALITKGKS